MNTKMTTNSQLSISETNKEPNTQKQNKQTTRIGTESWKLRTWRVISREGKEGERGNVQGIRSINGRYKRDRGMVRIS